MEVTESNYRVCKQCKQSKLRSKAGIRPNGKDSRFVGEDGQEWNGKVCPACHAHNCKVKQKEKRQKKNEVPKSGE